MNNRFSIALFLTIVTTNIILYFFLPLNIVTKWDFNGTPTSTIDKGTFVIVNIILCSFVFFLFLALSKAASNRKFLLWIGNTILLFLFFVDIVITLIALGFSLPLDHFIFIALGLSFILIGYFSTKIDTSKSTVSLEWNDKHLEKRASNICSISMIIAGIFLAGLPFIVSAPYKGYAILAIILGMTLVILPSTIYLLIKDSKQSTHLKR
ncbi:MULTISPECIES: DUF1648 domain-containing protein [Bacillus cereus group]|uniref:DUF1648 domain-containing protein n=1 Tax=Bacillus cereus group TaxID=86661 RepID=UPI0001A1DBFC|nr:MULTISPECIES: DUF1648 domain-containing protein [Bacillus cereus group]HDR4428887.1 hypothetical protein [Bacillus cereus]ARZ62261.1 hypothetical protein B7P25_10755 [Bacillus thuringiensis]EEM72055.1 hypothetical protein bthur0009_18780 [Bacillus thuringiensis serovar andalousiensis BGSC 4AW1]MEB9630800.1 DUF1648 domain-containing protein [Bacillus anthracis]OUA93698.1 hypothetical protein BK714_26750 [Bacillus thuringiensis serovar oswaldocruzi]